VECLFCEVLISTLALVRDWIGRLEIKRQHMLHFDFIASVPFGANSSYGCGFLDF
jgi:hypothetical protein